MTPCHHATPGTPLCPACRADYDADPSAWEEFGCHSQGDANTRTLWEQLAADAVQPDCVVAPASEIPF